MQSGTKTVTTGNKKQRHARRRFIFSEPTPTSELETMKGNTSAKTTIEAYGRTIGLDGPDVQKPLHWEERVEACHLKKTQSMPTMQKTPSKGIKPEANGQDQVLGQSASQQGKTPSRKRLTSSQNRTPKSCGNLANINQTAPRWAAGGFANSPPPSSLPIPAFDFDDIVDAEPKAPQPHNMDTVVANQVVPEPVSSPTPSHALSIQPLNQSPQIIRNSPPETRLVNQAHEGKSFGTMPTNIDHKPLHSPSPRRATHPIVMSPSHSMPNLHGVISNSPPLNKPILLDDNHTNNLLGQPVVMAISPPPYGYYVPQPGQGSPPTGYGGGGNLEQLSSELRRMLNIPVLATTQ